MLADTGRRGEVKPGLGIAGRDGVMGADGALSRATKGFMKRGRRGVIPERVASAGLSSTADGLVRLANCTGRLGRAVVRWLKRIVFKRRSRAINASWPVESLHTATRAGRFCTRPRPGLLEACARRGASDGCALEGSCLMLGIVREAILC